MKNLLWRLLCFSVALLPIAGIAQQPFVHFRHGSEIFPPNIHTPESYQSVSTEVINHYFVRYVQFTHILSDEQRASLENEGVLVMGYLDFGTYLLALPENMAIDQIVKLEATSIQQPKALWKMHQNLIERPLGAWAVHGNQVDAVLQLYPFVSIAEGAELCAKAGISVIEQGTTNGYLVVRLDQEDLENTAGLAFVHWMELLPPPAQKEDLNGRSLHRANLLDSDHPLGKKYNGEGVSVLVRDDGAVGPHIDFQGRLYNQDGSAPALEATHGDGVAGIIGGAGNLDPTKKGMAAGADIYVIDYVNSFQDQTLALFNSKNVTITNSSYSDGCNAGYTFASQNVDQQIFDNPTLMHVFSAGNSNGTDCSYGAGAQWGNITGGHKMAKNAIATANLRVDGTIESSSSRGPAYDGRIKPDISAHGTDQNSTDPANGYQVFGGTSAAAPGIAGCLAQLTQAYRTINNTPDVPTALLKTALMTTANDLGNPGPDFIFGWGHVNNYKALQLLEQHRYLTNNISQGGNNTHGVIIPAGIKEARLMIYWVDPEAQQNAAKALLNDLDLQVIGADGTTYKPWLLDPTPNANNLNTPAVTGVDHLNNMEQVSIKNPVPGDYEVKVTGYNVPFGPQLYYFAWEFLTDDIKITYPSGGEGLVSGNSVWVRWDALGETDPFTLKYSLDNGGTYTTIAELSKSARMYNWQVPGVISGNVKMALIRGAQSDTTDYAFTIAPVPTAPVVQKVCPDEITLSWNKINNDTIAYDAYALGEKYMELKATSLPNQSSVTFPVTDASKDGWYSIRASTASGLAGRRTLAIYYPGGLLGCAQSNDLSVNQIINPADGALFACGVTTEAIKVQVKNEGLTTATGATVWYQYQNQPMVEENLPDIAPGETLIYTFATPITIGANGVISLTSGVNFQDDTYLQNNTRTETFSIVNQSTAATFTNTFESVNLPAGWVNVNPDASIGWARSGQTMVSSNGAFSRTYWVNHANYAPAGAQEDYLYTIPVNLTTMNNPVLLFDYTHAQLDAVTKETLRVEGFLDCDLTTPIVLWEKTDPELKSLVTTTPFIPSDAAQWKKASVALSAYIGHSMVIRFVTKNAHGNNTFIDNIAVKDIQPIPPTASFSIADTICRSVPVTVTADPSTGSENVYNWYFGSLASPADATGPGPHDVTYLIPGTRSIRLIVTNPFGTDTITQSFYVIANPTPNFTKVADGLTVTFTNNSQSATDYIWDFGNGNTSTVKSPVHTYAAAGTYTVKLTAKNKCASIDKSTVLTLTVGVYELTGLSAVNLLPNPNNGSFMLDIDSPESMKAQFSLLDAAGKLIDERTMMVQQGKSILPFDYQHIAAGNYQLKIQTTKGVAALGVQVIK